MTTRRLREHHGSGGTVASVCSGAFALAAAGLLENRRCATHHELQDRLADRCPGAVVVQDVLCVADDRVVSSAGIASGIDFDHARRGCPERVLNPPRTGVSC